MLQRHDKQFGVNLFDMKVERGKNQTYTLLLNGRDVPTDLLVFAW